jgi:hypothetical protein
MRAAAAYGSCRCSQNSSNAERVCAVLRGKFSRYCTLGHTNVSRCANPCGIHWPAPATAFTRFTCAHPFASSLPLALRAWPAINHARLLNPNQVYYIQRQLTSLSFPPPPPARYSDIYCCPSALSQMPSTCFSACATLTKASDHTSHR